MTTKRPVLRQATRWSSTFAMVRRYIELKDVMDKIDDDEITSMLLSRRDEKALLAVLESLAKFESTSKELQNADGITLLDVRDLFDALIKEAPQVKQYLGPDASIVKSPEFESACVQVLLGNEAAIPEKETSVLNKLVSGGSRPASTQSPAAAAREDFAKDTLVEARRQREKAPRYKNHVTFIAPTSNIVERFFSQAKAVLGMYRQSMTPLHLESILFLKINRAYWNAATVRKVVRGEVPTN